MIKRSPPSSPKESDVLNIGLGSDDDEEEDKGVDKEVQGGKFKPHEENLKLSFFSHELLVKQQLNKCGGNIITVYNHIKVICGDVQQSCYSTSRTKKFFQ